LRSAPLRPVHHCHSFAFLPLLKELANTVFSRALLYQRSRHTLVRNFRLFPILRLCAVRHYHQFPFLLVTIAASESWEISFWI
jgi:hypothetical protein